MLQHARVIQADHAGGLGEAAPRQNRIDRGVGRGPDPEPLQDGLDAPAGFIETLRAAVTRLTPTGVP